MNARRFALIFGIIYVLVGIAGFLPPLLQPPEALAPNVAVDSLHGRLFGIFPVNILHTLFHLGTGLWGIYAAKSLAKSVTFSKSLAVIYAVLTVMGLIPGLYTVFGLIPLYGNDVWLHAGTALVAAYFGFSKSARNETVATHRT